MKRARKSKTISLNGLGLLGLFVPHFDQWITAHPKEILGGVLALNIVLRFVSKDRIELAIPEVIKKMNKLYSLAIIVAAGLCLGATNCAQIPIDRAMAASEGHDYVLVLSGLGEKSNKGYLFAQMRDKAASTGVISATFPATTCARESCVKFQFFRKDGSPGYGVSLPKGVTQADLKLSDVIGHDGLVQPSDEGEYSVLAQVYYIGQDNTEYSMLGNGFVRVNVLNAAYLPVACNDGAVAWKTKLGVNCEAQFTSGFRSALCGDCK